MICKLELDEIGDNELIIGEFSEPFNIKESYEIYKRTKLMRMISHRFVNEKKQLVLLNDNTMYSFRFDWAGSKDLLCRLLCKKVA